MNDGEILEMLLKEKNISIRDLAAKANIPEQTLYSMKKRKNNRTGNEIRAKISKALDIPISIWDTSKEDLVIRKTFGSPTNNSTRINKENFYTCLQFKNKTIDNIKYALDFLGYHYSLEELKNIIDNQIPVDQRLGETIEYILMNDTIITQKEFDTICRMRSLSKESRDFLDTTIRNLIKVDAYEDLKMKELCEQLSK